MSKSERINKNIYSVLIDYLRNDIDDTRLIVEAVDEVLWEQGFILTPAELTGLVDQLWDQAVQQVQVEQEEAEAAYEARQSALCDAIAGRW